MAERGPGKPDHITEELLRTDPAEIFLNCIGAAPKIAEGVGDVPDPEHGITPRQRLTDLRDRLRLERSMLKEFIDTIVDQEVTDLTIYDMQVMMLLVDMNMAITGTDTPPPELDAVWDDFDELIGQSLEGNAQAADDFNLLIFYGGMYMESGGRS